MMATMPTHAEIARNMTIRMADGVFAHAARDAVTHADFTTLERMFPGMRFRARPLGPDAWELSGHGDDGSTVLWTVAG